MERRLITIPISHYCEKARWALERAGLEYAEERHVQGVHQVVARRTGGGSTVPVLVAPEGVFTESEQILEYADERVDDDARLFPRDPGLRREVEDLSRELDERFGPAGRRVMYAHMFEQRRLMLRVNNQGVPTWERIAMTALWPVAVRWGTRMLGMGPNTKRDDEPVVREVFDQIAARLADGGPHLFGDRFTAADLTFAALSAAVIVPPQYGVSLPQPEVLAPETAAMVRRFRDHPAGVYAMGLFETHRRVGSNAA
jgi:glutathione S-transferase